MNARISLRALLTLSLLLAACGREEPRYDDQGHSVEGTAEADIEVASPTFNILNLLRATGNKVKVTGVISRPFFESKGRTLLVNDGVNLEVYEFGSAADLNAAVAKISPDGSTVAGEAVQWPASPHFYKTERVIILYFGDDADNRRALEGAFGQQFAGRV
jgi:hypothetical protein